MGLGQFAYANNSNRFLAAEPLTTQPFAIVGVPFDGAVTHRPGARFGPQEIRRASLMLCDGLHPWFEVSPLPLLGDALDMRLPNASALALVREQIQVQATALMARHHCVFLGGDHSVTLPLLRAAHALHGALALVHFDAHCDTWQDHFGEPSGHGTWTFEAMAEGLISPAHTVQIGLRSSGERAAREYVQDQGGLIFTARQLRGLDGAAYRELLVTDLRSELSRITAPTTVLYVAFDFPGMTPEMTDGIYGGSFANLSGATLTRIDDSAHFIMLDQPARFTAEVNAFLE